MSTTSLKSFRVAMNRSVLLFYKRVVRVCVHVRVFYMQLNTKPLIEKCTILNTRTHTRTQYHRKTVAASCCVSSSSVCITVPLAIKLIFFP